MQQSSSVALLFGASCLFSGAFLTGCGSSTTTTTSTTFSNPTPGVATSTTTTSTTTSPGVATSTTTTSTTTSSTVVADNYLFESYKFYSGVSKDQITDVATKFFALKSQCLRDNLPVIASLSGGLQNAPEMTLNGQGYTEGFVAKFLSEEDRAFYDNNCTAREEFKDFVGSLIDDETSPTGPPAYNAGCLVFDYTDLITAAGGERVSPPTVHMVFFRFKEGIATDTQDDVMARFLALKDECTTDGRPIVQELVAGDATSVPAENQLYSQGYYVQFGSEQDRDIYIGCPEVPCQKGGTPIIKDTYCKAHDDFKMYAGEFFETTPGPFSSETFPYSAGRFSFNFISEETAEIVA